MSIAWITRVWASPEPVSPGERLLLLALADMANDEGICWPSVPTLARRCAMDPYTTRRSLRRLEADGFIVREMSPGRSTHYRLLQHGSSTSGNVVSQAETEPPAGLREMPSWNRAAPVSVSGGVEHRIEELAGLLVKRGVREPVAIRLARRHDDAHIRRHIAHYDALCTRSRVRRGPGWLVASIQDDYVIPESLPDAFRLFTYKEALAWIERNGITLSPASPITRWFEPVKQPGGHALFRRKGEVVIPGRCVQAER